MATVSFKKGLLANLPSSYTEGTFYVTTDEHGLYLDVDGSTRVRIGDFQEFENLDALQSNVNPSTTALYYIKDLNVLAKWDGAKYVQINLDTGATSVEVTGSGNAVTQASYDPASRKLTLTMGETFTTAGDVDAKITAKVGEIGEDTVKAYVDKKTEGIASDEALTQLGERVTTAEGDIDALETLVGETPVADQIDAKIAALDLSNTYETKGAADAAKAELIGGAEDTSDKDTIKGAKKYAEEKATAAQTAAVETANGYTDGKIAELNIGQYAKTEDVDSKVAAAKTELIGTDGDTGTSDTIKGAKKYAEEQIAAQVASAYKAAGSVDFASLPALSATEEGKVYNVTDAFSTTEDFIEGAGKSYPAGTNVVCIDTGDETFKWDVLAGMVDLSAYDTAEVAAGKVATAKQEAIDAAASDATSKANAALEDAKEYADGLNTAMDGRVTAVEADKHTHANKALLDTYTQTEENLADAVAKKHTHANATELDKIADGDKAKWDAMEQNAKDYADGLAVNYDAAGSADEAEAAAKEYTDTALTWGSF